jgi:hypothetical protein
MPQRADLHTGGGDGTVVVVVVVVVGTALDRASGVLGGDACSLVAQAARTAAAIRLPKT